MVLTSSYIVRNLLVLTKAPKISAKNALNQCQKMEISKALHRKTDGQSERMFRTTETMLRYFIWHTQEDWKRYLAGLEFVCIIHINDRTKLSLYFLEYAQNTLSHAHGSFQTVVQSWMKLNGSWYNEEATKFARMLILSLNTKIADDANTTSHDFEVGEIVQLSTKTYTIETRKSKEVL